VTLLLKGGCRSNGAWQQPHNPIDDRGCGQLAAGEHEVADRHLLIGQAADSLVEALVMAAEQHQLLIAAGPAL
jgi:hypothetical protein